MLPGHHISGWLARNGIIPAQESCLYSYAFRSLLWGILPMAMTAALSALLGMPKEALWIILPYMLLRKFCGGFHFRSPVVCFFFTATVLTAALLLFKVILNAVKPEFAAIPIMLSSVFLCAIGPIETPERKLSPKEKNVFQAIIWFLVCLLLGICFLLYQTGEIAYAAALCVGIVLVAVSDILWLVINIFIISKCSKTVS